MEPFWAVVWGFAGGVAAEFVSLFQLRRTLPVEMPHYIKTRLYWILTFAMTVVGAVVTLAYSESGVKLNPILAMNIGASAPLLIQNLTGGIPREVPPPDPARID